MRAVNYTLVRGARVVARGVVCDLGLLRTRLLLRKAFWTAYAIIVCFQLIVNGILTGHPDRAVRPDRIIGWRIAYAPVEDLLFGFAMVLVTLDDLGVARASRAASPPRRPQTASARPRRGGRTPT